MSGPAPQSDRRAVSRLVIAASSFAPHKGGVEELVAQLAREHIERGGSAQVLTMRWPKSLSSAETVDAVPVRRFLYRTPEGSLRRRIIAYASMPLTVAAVARELRRSDAEVVHIQCVSSAAWFVEKAARLVGLPLVVTMQGELTMDATGIYARSAFLRRTLRHLLRTADAVTACSRHTLEEAEAWAGVPLGGRGSVIPNGVRMADFDEAAPGLRGRPYVFAVGRHVPQKGFDILLGAFSRLVAGDGFDWDLVLAGDGPSHDSLIECAHELRLADRVHFTGATSRPETRSLFEGCELFVLPSRHEPFGIVNLEAMAAAKPIVASRVGGVPEFVTDGEVGLLVEPGDPVELASAIRRLYDDRVFAAQLAQAGRRRVSEFDWGVVYDRYQALYQQVVERGSQRGPSKRPGAGAHWMTSRRPQSASPRGVADRVPGPVQDFLRSARDCVSPGRRHEAESRRRSLDREVGFAQRVSPEGRVLGGPFCGIRLPWRASSGSMVPLLAGSYEMELWPAIEELIERRPTLVIDVGAAEGYYAIGLATRLPSARVEAFDIDREARRLCREAVVLNGVDNVTVRGRTSARDLGRRLVPGALVVADSERFEIELLDPAVAPALVTVDLLVEVHEFLRPGATDLLGSRFGPTHDIEMVDVVDRLPADHPQLAHLSNAEAEAAVREGRPQEPPMQWAVMRRRARGAPADPRR